MLQAVLPDKVTVIASQHVRPIALEALDLETTVVGATGVIDHLFIQVLVLDTLH